MIAQLLLILVLVLSIALIPPPPSLLDQLPITEQLQWVIDQ